MDKWIIEKKKDKETTWNQIRILEYTPIKIENDKIIIEKKWFNQQNSKFQVILLKQFTNALIEDFELPHTYISANELKDIYENPKSLYWDFLKLYKQEFLFDNYAHLFEDVTIVQLSDEDINGLLALCILFQSEKRNVKPKDLDHLPNNLIEKIKDSLDKYDLDGDGVFVKTSIKSGKHYQKCFPCYNIDDVLTNLVFSKEVMQSLLSDKCNLVFRKWNTDVRSNNEFRVYILNGTIKGICQAKIMELPHVTDTDIQQIILLVTELVTEKKITEQYNDCVLDVCYSATNNMLHLIEINSGGAWSTAGTALFTWAELINTIDPIFRILI